MAMAASSLRAAAAALALLCAAAAGAAPSWEAGNVTLDIQPQNGGFKAFSTSVGAGDPNAVTLSVDWVQEVDARGRAIGDNANGPHSLAARDFKVGSNEVVLLASAVNASKTAMRSIVGAPAPKTHIGKVDLDTYLLMEPAEVGQLSANWGGERPLAGDVKLSLALSGWTWCGCVADHDGSEQVGSFVEVTIAVKARSLKPARVPESSSTWDLGGGVLFELPGQALVDGKSATLPAGNPRIQRKAAGYVFVLRFPKFKASVVYEPLLRMSHAVSVNEPTTTSTVTTTTVTTTTTTAQLSDPLSGGNITVRVSRKGGSFTAYALNDEDDDKVVVAMNALREVDARGKVVGNSNPRTHSVATFASEVFDFGAPQRVNLGTARGTQLTSVYPVNKHLVKFETTVVSRAGVLARPNETVRVAAGDVKWQVELAGWTWCGCVQNGVPQQGQFVEVEVAVRGSLAKPFQSPVGKGMWDLGGGVLLELPSTVELDGAPVDLPEGYPRLETRPKSPVVVLRVPKFGKSAVYQALVRMSQSETLSHDAQHHQPPAFVSAARPSGLSAASGLGLALALAAAARPGRA